MCAGTVRYVHLRCLRLWMESPCKMRKEALIGWTCGWMSRQMDRSMKTKDEWMLQAIK